MNIIDFAKINSDIDNVIGDICREILKEKEFPNGLKSYEEQKAYLINKSSLNNVMKEHLPILFDRIENWVVIDKNKFRK